MSTGVLFSYNKFYCCHIKYTSYLIIKLIIKYALLRVYKSVMPGKINITITK